MSDAFVALPVSYYENKLGKIIYQHRFLLINNMGQGGHNAVTIIKASKKIIE